MAERPTKDLHVNEPFRAERSRYDSMSYRRSGRSGLQLPAMSLGLWQNFGDDAPLAKQRRIVRTAFDHGITHFDLANNYGPPPGATERNFGRILALDFRAYRDEMIVSTKAGYDMWPGPYGQWGSRKHLLASLDASLRRLGLDYVDIFYSHRVDPDTPLEETMSALDHAVRSGRAVYAGISSYSPQRTAEAASIMRELGTPLVVHQPSYSMFNRWIERGLLDTVEDLGLGVVAFSPLAQGLLTSKYLNGVPDDPQTARAARGGSFAPSIVTDDVVARLRALNDIAASRGQTLAQLALVWALRDRRVTSVLVGARTVDQLLDNLGALERQDLTAAELDQIEHYAVDADLNIWARSSQA